MLKVILWNEGEGSISGASALYLGIETFIKLTLSYYVLLLHPSLNT